MSKIYLVILLMVSGYCMSIGQSAKEVNKSLMYSIEYSPNYSSITEPGLSEGNKLSHNLFLKASYTLNKMVALTGGVGYLNTGSQNSTDIMGPGDLEKVIFINHSNYLLFPLGLKINLNDFYIHPELGFGLNLSNKTKNTQIFADETIIDTYDTLLNFGTFNSKAMTLLLSLGKEFQFNNSIICLGVKTYYGLSQVVLGVPRNNRFLGYGLVIGYSF